VTTTQSIGQLSSLTKTRKVLEDMSATAQIAPDADALAPVVDDMSAFIISGALRSHKLDSPYRHGRPHAGARHRTTVWWPRSSASGASGCPSGWTSSQADVILSGIGARTSRLQPATGVCPSPHATPVLLAALGSTMHSCYARGSYSAWDSSERGT